MRQSLIKGGETVDKPDTYTCAKCGCTTYNEGEVFTQGGMAAIFGITSRQFTTISCDQCGYTDFYNVKHDSGPYG